MVLPPLYAGFIGRSRSRRHSNDPDGKIPAPRNPNVFEGTRWLSFVDCQSIIIVAAGLTRVPLLIGATGL
jgi:hypothetical protein